MFVGDSKWAGVGGACKLRSAWCAEHLGSQGTKEKHVFITLSLTEVSKHMNDTAYLVVLHSFLTSFLLARCGR